MTDWCENELWGSTLRQSEFVRGRKRESRGEDGGTNHTLGETVSPGFSYLGVPAPAGMSDWYESMSRTPIRDVRALQ